MKSEPNVTTNYECYPWYDECGFRGKESDGQFRDKTLFICTNCGFNTKHEFCYWARVNGKWLVTRIRRANRNGKVIVRKVVNV